MRKKPIIGIVLDLVKKSDNDKAYSNRDHYALRCDYSDVITSLGAVPLYIPYCLDIDRILESIDGLIIPGGDEDINPKFYGQKIISDKVKVNDKRASFELSLAKRALELDMPIFGICNGLQLINVVMGGTLIQHIPDRIQSDINHEQPKPKEIPTHSVFIKEDTLFRSLSEADKIEVNTTHHQSIDEIAPGLLVSGRAPDGIIEAIESTNHQFVVGVQWHSEYLNTDLDRNLFKRLIEESSKSV